MENDVTILSSHFCLNFSKLSCPNGKNVCSFYEACIRMALPKPGGGGAHGGVMIHHIWTTQHNLDQPKKFNHPTQTLVKTSLTNITKVVHNSETVRNIRSIHESPKSVTLSHLQLWSTYQSPKVMAKSAWQSHRQTKQAVNRQLRSTEKTSHRKG